MSDQAPVRQPLSVVICARNEERRLEACLRSVAWADEIVLVDDGSTDRTVEIARKYTDRIVARRLDVEGVHRNAAYAFALHEWVLSLDADERVTSELRAELSALLSSAPACVAYAIPIRSYIGSTWIRSAGYYPAEKVRLFKRSKFRYEESEVHPRIFVDGPVGKLKGDVLHYSWKDFSDFVAKLNNQTTLEARKWAREGRRVSLGTVLRKCLTRFWKAYVQKGGFREGVLGFMFSFFHCLYQILAFAKCWEITRNGGSGESGPPAPGLTRGRASEVVLIDRDGVLNEDRIGGYITRPEDFRWIPGSLEALQQLSAAGFGIVIVSNQAGVGDGVFTQGELDAVNAAMLDALRQAGVTVRGVYTCVHGKEAGCACRKPETGLFEQAWRDLAFDRARTYFIGDKASDLEAGDRFGVPTILVRTGYGECASAELGPAREPAFVAADLAEAVQFILTRSVAGPVRS